MTTGVLLMAYGSPTTPRHVELYLKDIRQGRSLREGLVEEVTARYQAIGGDSPLNEITARQAVALEHTLGDDFRAYVGMKHWHPFIAETVQSMFAAGIRDVIGIALAPHFSTIGIGGYEQRLRAAAADLPERMSVTMIPSWYDEPAFVSFAGRRLADTVGRDRRGTRVFFTAHSLPARILDAGDPYRNELLASAALIASEASVTDWEFAFQSASQTGEPWLGPDILERLDAFAAESGRRAVIAPIGFVTDHLEILYDIDIECAQRAIAAGLAFARMPSPNDAPAFINALATVVRRAADPR